MKTVLAMKYLGGHPAHPKAANSCTLTVDDDGVKAKVFRPFLELSWDQVTSIEVDGPDEVAKRVTATRLLTTGIFAFALKKKQKIAYVTVTTPDGEAIFETEKVAPMELRAKLSWATAKAATAPQND